MRPAPALSALPPPLLLLLLLSLSPHDTVASNGTSPALTSTGQQGDQTTNNQSTAAAAAVTSSVGPTTTTPSSDQKQLSTSATVQNTPSAKDSKNIPDTAPQTTHTTAAVTRTTETPSSQKGSQSSSSAMMNTTTQGDGHVDSSTMQHPGGTADISSASPPPVASAGPQQPTPGVPKGPDQMTTAPSSPGTPAGHSCPPAGERTATTLITGPSITSQDLLTSSKMPTKPGTPSAIPGTTSPSPTMENSLSKTLQSTSSSGPVATTSVGTTDLRPQLASTAPQDSDISTPPLARKDDRITCSKTDRSLNESMLILNLTKTVHCVDSPLDDKLVTLLCQAAKSTFKPPQDECHIQLTVGSESQAVAVEGITIQTKHFLKDVYESLKDRRDDLKEVGVHNMKFKGQGPPDETEDRFSTPLIITIVSMASFLLLVAALYGCCHQRLSQRKDQQRLTEELQTVENGYHDNPTLEVMETSSEMQEKKAVNLNGELGDSWIVPLDNLAKDDLDEEEDTHL